MNLITEQNRESNILHNWLLIKKNRNFDSHTYTWSNFYTRKKPSGSDESPPSSQNYLYSMLWKYFRFKPDNDSLRHKVSLMQLRKCVCQIFFNNVHIKDCVTSGRLWRSKSCCLAHQSSLLTSLLYKHLICLWISDNLLQWPFESFFQSINILWKIMQIKNIHNFYSKSKKWLFPFFSRIMQP